MDNRPLITVIAAVYNVGDYVEKCVQSIIDQTWRELEIILVDDGSTDASGAICDRFAAQDSRVRVIHQKNSGTASGARNAGVDAASGQWVTYVDGDDYLDPDMVEYLYGLCEKTGCQIAQCGVRHVGFPVSKDIPGGEEDWQLYTGSQAAEYVLLTEKGFSATIKHTLFHESIVRGQRFRMVRCYEDLEYIVEAYLASEQVCFSTAQKYNYVWRSGNSYSTPLLSKLSDLDAVADGMAGLVKTRAPQLSQAVAQRYVFNAMTYILDYAARDGMSEQERPAMLALRRRVLDAPVDVRKLSRTSRLWYRALRLGMGPFTVTCKAVYALKCARTKLRGR